MKTSKGFVLTLLTITLGFVGFMIFCYQDDFRHLFTQLRPSYLGWLIVLQILLIGLSGFPFYVLVKGFGTAIHWQHWVGLSFIANLLNQLIPYRPGVAFRYIYLKRHYNLSLRVYSFATLFYFMILMLCGGLMVVVPGVHSPVATDPISLALLALFGAFVCLGFLLLLLRRRDSTTPKLVFMASIKRAIKRPNTLVLSLGGFLLLQGLTLASFWTIFHGLGNPIPFDQLVMLVGLVTLGLLFPITPGNLGVLELMLGGMTEALYGQFGLGFSAIMIFRIAQLLVALCFGSLFSFWLFGGIKALKNNLPAQQ